ncbi:MAG: HEAT repeat domain-containing protein [Isosphaeraceae bacterium]
MPSNPDLVFLIHGTFAHRHEDSEPSADQCAWWQKNSGYVEQMNRLFAGRAECWPEDVCRAMPWAKASFWRRVGSWTVAGRKPFGRIRPKHRLSNRLLFAWPGLNSESERRKAGRRLLEGLLALEIDNRRRMDAGEPPRSYHLIGHSHGGTVIWNTLRFAEARGVDLPNLRSWTSLGTPFPTYQPIRYRGLVGLLGLATIAVAGWWALYGTVAQIPHPFNFGRLWMTVRTLLDPSSPAKLFPPNVSPVTFTVLWVLLILAGWFAFAVITEPLRWLESRRERLQAASAWRRFGDRWLGLFSPIDEAIAGAQNTVGLYTSNLVRLHWPGLPPMNLLRAPFWLANWVVVPLANWIALPLAEWIISLVFQLKFQGSDRLGTRLVLVSPEPFSRAEFPDAIARGPLPEPLAAPLHSRVGNRIDSKILASRRAFAADARGPRSPNELLKSYATDVKVTHELVHNSYCDVDILRRATAYHILRHDPEAEITASLIDVRDWLDGNPLSPPDPGSYLPAPKPPSSTPTWTYFLLGAAFVLLCTIGFGGLRHDLDATYVDQLVDRMTAKDGAGSEFNREAFELVRPKAEQSLVESIVDRDSGPRRKGMEFLHELAEEPGPGAPARFSDSGTFSSETPYSETIVDLVDLVLNSNVDPRVQIEGVKTLIAISSRAHGLERALAHIYWRLGVKGAGPILSGAADRAPRKAAELDAQVARTAVMLAAQLSPRPRSELEKILTSPSPAACILATVLLGKIGDPGSVLPLGASMGRRDANIRSAVVRALSRIDSPLTLEAVTRTATDKTEDMSVRFEAITALSDFRTSAAERSKSAVETLKKILHEGSYDLRSRAIAALGKFGKGASAAVPDLLAMIPRADDHTRAVVTKALADIGDKRAVKPLIRELSNRRAVFAPITAIEALGAFHDREAVGPLIKILTDSSRDDRCQTEAARALAEIRDPSAVGPLIQILRNPHSYHPAIADPLAAIGKPSVGPLIEMLDDSAPFVSDRAVRALARIGRDASPAVERLVGMLNSESKRWQAASALAEIGDPRAVKPLIKLMKGENQHWNPGVFPDIARFRESAAEAVPLLAEFLGDETREWFERSAAAGALGEIGVAAAVEPLEKALHVKDVNVRSDAAKALGRLGKLAVSAVDPLNRILRYGVSETRSAAAQALGAIGHPDACPQLRDALGDEMPVVRAEAHKALVRIGEPALPILFKAIEHGNDDGDLTTATILETIHEPSEDQVARLFNLTLSSHVEARQVALDALARILLAKVHDAQRRPDGSAPEKTRRDADR